MTNTNDLVTQICLDAFDEIFIDHLDSLADELAELADPELIQQRWIFETRRFIATAERRFNEVINEHR